MLGVIMYAGKAAMEPLPNIHPLALFIVATTLVYRRRALYPLYAYVLINGLLAGFAPWWLPYLYIWLPLWGAALLLPRGTGPRAAAAASRTSGRRSFTGRAPPANRRQPFSAAVRAGRASAAVSGRYRPAKSAAQPARVRLFWVSMRRIIRVTDGQSAAPSILRSFGIWVSS